VESRDQRPKSRIAHPATKGGVLAMTKQLAAESTQLCARVNFVSPRMIIAPATQRDLLADDRSMRLIEKSILQGCIGQPGEVARCALFLAGEDATYVTGANLVVDGRCRSPERIAAD
jgi:meso-butanediol dehydrogenase/(S,S)-butanediol dehydrogenase/diacetyl reductase